MIISRLLKEIIDTCPAVHSSSITLDKRTSYIGFIKGIIQFIDGSLLHLREFVDVEADLDRYMYAYHYQNEEQFIFRYDNTEHHQKLDLFTFPHHKHEGTESNVITSPAPSLANVLIEIESLLDIS